ncbi:MAG: hypothetical protein RQ847_03205 [Wenzhouxiangellaceae bacterium]|nr:hypothetical protein [Wenzhouxiangellaceae bacterium]
MKTEYEPDPDIADFVLVTEIAESRPLAEPIFKRKYRTSAPPSDFGFNVFALIHTGENAWRPASYVTWSEFEGARLIAGACTDGELLRALPEDQQQRLNEAGGLMLQTVRYGEARLAKAGSIASFGYCGDARSWSILEQCGYRRLDHEFLIVRWNRDLPEAARRKLIGKVEALGVF